MVRYGWVWLGRLGMVRYGQVWLGMVRYGQVGKVGQVGQVYVFVKQKIPCNAGYNQLV